MAAKYDILKTSPNKESPRQFLSDAVRTERPGIRSKTFAPESISDIDGAECRMRNKTVRVTTESAFEMIFENDAKGVQWEKDDQIMLAVHEYCVSGDKEVVVKKGELVRLIRT